MGSVKRNAPSSVPQENLEPLSPQGDPWRIVLGVGNEKDQKLLSQQLNQLGIESDLSVLGKSEGEEFLPDTFDMAILDESKITEKVGLKLKEVKESQHPLFTPVLTLVSEKTRDEILARYGEITNELLTKPLRKRMLNTRIKNLLNLRYLSEELEVKYRAITQNTYELISIIDEEGNCLFANETYRKLLGHDPDELSGKQAFHLLHENDKEKLRDGLSKFMDKVKRGKAPVGEGRELDEVRITDSEGNYRWVKPVIVTLGKVDGTDRLLVTSRDVTDQKEAYQRVQYLNQLYNSTSQINKLLVREGDFGVIMKKSRNILLERVQYVAVELAEFGQGEEEAVYLGYRDSPQWKLKEGEIHAPSCIKRALETLDSVVVDFPGKLCQDCEFGLCRDENHQSIALPLAVDGNLAGAMVVKLKPGEVVLEEELDLLEEVASDLAYAHDKLRTEKELEETTIGILEALSQTVEEDDEYTGEHINRVRDYSLALGEKLGLSEEELNQLRYASELHDVGKVKVPDKILGKPGELTEDEWEEMEKHPKAGEEIVRNIPRLKGTAKIIGQHQEKYDGTGYPEGLQGEEIELGARIIAVVDAWDAMQTDRPYRDALPKDVAISELKENSGTQFDPEVVEVFMEMIEKGELS